MPAGDVYQLTAEMTFDNQQVVNGYHFVQVGVDGSGDPREAVALIWNDLFQAPFSNLVSNNLEINNVRVRKVLPIQTQAFVLAVNEQGSVAGDVLPTNMCAVLRLYGILSGRKGIGNLRIPGVVVTFIADGQVDASYVGIAEIFGNLFEADQTEAGSGFVFRSCVLGTDDVARTVQRAVMTSRIKQLRSRTVGQGD